jgi:hypothetical protein
VHVCRPLAIAAVAMMIVGFALPAIGSSVSVPARGSPALPFFVTKTKSDNWGGYAVTASGGSVTAVKGSWVVPAVTGTCPSRAEYSSFWIGIDGYSSTTVEQTGTDTDCSGGTPHYYAWYEFYPANSVNIASVPIHAGDKISASVTYSGTFTVHLADLTTGKTVSISHAVSGAKRTSAEWIVETPEICGASCQFAHLTDFGTVSFASDDATISGVTAPIGNFSHVYEITIENTAHTKNMATPSALGTNRSSFTVRWLNAGP